MHTIQVPTDQSDVSLNALNVAATIVHAKQANILLLHVVPIHALP